MYENSLFCILQREGRKYLLSTLIYELTIKPFVEF